MRTYLRIGEVAHLLAVTAKTIRHYHKVGLLTWSAVIACLLLAVCATAVIRCQVDTPQLHKGRPLMFAPG